MIYGDDMPNTARVHMPVFGFELGSHTRCELWQLHGSPMPVPDRVVNDERGRKGPYQGTKNV